ARPLCMIRTVGRGCWMGWRARTAGAGSARPMEPVHPDLLAAVAEPGLDAEEPIRTDVEQFEGHGEVNRPDLGALGVEDDPSGRWLDSPGVAPHPEVVVAIDEHRIVGRDGGGELEGLPLAERSSDLVGLLP